MAFFGSIHLSFISSKTTTRHTARLRRLYSVTLAVVLGIGLLSGMSATAQTPQQITNIPDQPAGAGSPVAPASVATDASTHAAYVLNADGSLLYIDGSQPIPVAKPTSTCTGTSAPLGPAGGSVNVYQPAGSSAGALFPAGSSGLVGISAVVGSTCPTPSAITFANPIGAYSPFGAVDTGLGKVYQVSASEGGSPDQLIIVDVMGTTYTAESSPPTLDYSAAYNSVAADNSGSKPTHLVFVSEIANYAGGTNQIFVIDPTVSPAKVTKLTGFTGTLFILPPQGSATTGQLVVAGGTTINVFNLSDFVAYSAGGAAPTPVSGGTYDASLIPGVSNLLLESPILDTVNSVLYGNLTGDIAATIPSQLLFTVALSALNSNTSTAVGQSLGALDSFDPGLGSGTAIGYGFALTPNPTNPTHPRLYAVPTYIPDLFAPDPNATAVQVYDTSASPITALAIPLTGPCSGAAGTCPLQPTAISSDASNGNVYIPGFTASSASPPVDAYSVAVLQVTAAPVNKLCGTVTSNQAQAGVPTSITVFECDSSGNPITTYTGTVAFTSTDKQAMLPAPTAYTVADHGSQTFIVTFNTAGSQTLTYTDTQVATTTGSTTFTVAPGAPSSLKATGGTPQTTTASQPFASALAAQVQDAEGNAVPGISVTFTAPSSGPSGTFAGGKSAATVLTDATGTATAPTFTADASTGTFAVTASAAGISGQALFNLTTIAAAAISPGVSLIPGTINTVETISGSSAAGSILSAVAFDAAGDLYVLDSGLNTITEFPVGGLPAKTIVSPAAAQSLTLNTPSDMLYEPALQSLLVSDYENNRLVRVSLGSSITLQALTLGGIPAAAAACSNPVSGTSLCLPTGLAEDASGNIYVSDTGDGRVLKLSSTGVYQATPISAGATGLNAPMGLAIDSAGNLYIANNNGASTNGSILEISFTGDVTALNLPSLIQPFGVAVDPAGDLYFSDIGAHTVGFIQNGGTALLFAGNGSATDSGDHGSAVQAGIAAPLGIALDAENNVYVADSVQTAASGGLIRQISTALSYLNFGSAEQGSPSPAQLLTIVNPNATPIEISSLSLGGANASDFAISRNCELQLPAAGSCVLSVVFTPSTLAAESAVITITDSTAGASPVTQTIQLTGTGSQSQVAATPTFTPTSSSSSSSSLQVFIASSTPDATITFTVTTPDGVTQLAPSATLPSAAALTVTQCETITASATAPGFSTSPSANATYFVGPCFSLLATAANTTSISPPAATVGTDSNVLLDTTEKTPQVLTLLLTGNNQFASAVVLSSNFGKENAPDETAAHANNWYCSDATGKENISCPTVPTAAGQVIYISFIEGTPPALAPGGSGHGKKGLLRRSAPLKKASVGIFGAIAALGLFIFIWRRRGIFQAALSICVTVATVTMALLFSASGGSNTQVDSFSVTATYSGPNSQTQTQTVTVYINHHTN